MASAPVLRSLAVFLGIVFLAPPASPQGVPRLDSYNGVAVRILQSNNAGNIHHIIDPTTNRVTGLIRGCANPHNLTTHPDGLYYYCSNESEDTVDVFDTKTLQLVTQIPLSGNPNKIVVNKKHKKIYAGIRALPADKRAVVDVIDIATHKRLRSVAVHHPVHNTYVTPDDNFVIAGLSGESKAGGTDDPGDRSRQGRSRVGDGNERHISSTAATTTRRGRWPSRPTRTAPPSGCSRRSRASTPCG